jgi:hypothetical protein
MRKNRGCCRAGIELKAEQLASLFELLRNCRFEPWGSSNQNTRVPDPTMLQEMFVELSGSMKDLGATGNPWAAANLRRDELRNASVLAWFLNPRNGHGMGDGLLRSLLAEVGRKRNFPQVPSRACTVLVEECPDGLASNRVDIIIDDPKFLLIVEVKIDAPEQASQIERYCQIAKARTCDGRPWGVVFLTPTGRKPLSGHDFEAEVIPMPWGKIGRFLHHESRLMDEKSRYISRTFALHVSNI